MRPSVSMRSSMTMCRPTGSVTVGSEPVVPARPVGRLVTAAGLRAGPARCRTECTPVGHLRNRVPIQVLHRSHELVLGDDPPGLVHAERAPGDPLVGGELKAHDDVTDLELGL